MMYHLSYLDIKHLEYPSRDRVNIYIHLYIFYPFTSVYIRLNPFISVYIRLYPFISLYICLYLFNFVYIHFYPFTSVYIRLYLFISVYIYFYLFTSIYIRLHLFISVYIYFYPFTSVYILFYPFISVYIRLYPFISVYIRFYKFISVYIPVCIRLYICLYLLISAYICCTFKYSKRGMSDLQRCRSFKPLSAQECGSSCRFYIFPARKEFNSTVTSLLFLKQKNANYFKHKPQLNIKENMNDISSIFSFFTRQSFSGYPLYIGH